MSWSGAVARAFAFVFGGPADDGTSADQFESRVRRQRLHMTVIGSLTAASVVVAVAVNRLHVSLLVALAV